MHEVKPSVLLVEEATFKRNVISKIYNGYRRCYSDLDSWLITDTKSKSTEEMEAFVRKMLKAEHPHESPLEHASLTFHVTCSRACSHQLVRHRIASYSQQSQRYVKMDDLPVIVPPSVQADQEFLVDYETQVIDAEELYLEAVHAGIPAEDARYLLPNCVATQIVVTMNFRSLLHFFNERCCNRAQWEIRDIANQMLNICKSLYPCVFESAGAKCKRLGHCPEAKPCGKQPWRDLSSAP